MEEYVDNLLAENAALRRKLQSKAEALLILSKELDECRRERDQFQLMAEQLQHRHSALKKKSLYLNQSPLLSSGAHCGDVGEDRSKALRLEAEELRQQLRDAHGDNKALRAQLVQQKIVPLASRVECSFPAHQKEEMVQQLEVMSIKCSQQSRDLQALLDEKEELILQRDSLRCKVHRLNYEFHQALSPSTVERGGSGDSEVNTPRVDLDSLITENVYLHERIQHAEQEKEMSAQNISKYKSMLEKKRSKGNIKLGTANNSGMVISHKQVQQLLSGGCQVPTTAAALADMRSLCLALLEALSDKGTALTHQKKTNRVLGRRVAELERKLGGADIFPSRLLLEGYAGADVDKEVNQILADSEDNTATDQIPSTSKIGLKEVLEEDENEEDFLPPQLQQMVLKALEDIKKENEASSK